MSIGSFAILEAQNVSCWYGENQVLYNVSLSIRPNTITALVGTSGCGKSTLLRCFNRMNELIPSARFQGKVLCEKGNIYDDSVITREEARYRFGMVFQRPNPFPKTIFENVAFGPRINGFRGNLKDLVEGASRKADLWEEVKDRLHGRALSLSGGQQQRLCIARALVVEPKVLLLDEPCSALDPIATGHIESLLRELAQEIAILIVTHNIEQARRLSKYMAFLHYGKLIEFGETEKMSVTPQEKLTEAFLTGRLPVSEDAS